MRHTLRAGRRQCHVMINEVLLNPFVAFVVNSIGLKNTIETDSTRISTQRVLANFYILTVTESIPLFYQVFA